MQINIREVQPWSHVGLPSDLVNNARQTTLYDVARPPRCPIAIADPDETSIRITIAQSPLRVEKAKRIFLRRETADEDEHQIAFVTALGVAKLGAVIAG